MFEKRIADLEELLHRYQLEVEAYRNELRSKLYGGRPLDSIGQFWVGKKMVEVPLSLEDNFVAIAAFRYALGAQSAAPSVIVSFLRGNWKRLSEATRARIVEELGKEIERDLAQRESRTSGPLGWECDRKTWVRFMEWTKEEADRASAG